MNRRINSRQRNYMIIGLCAILVIMAVGYAAFASQLRISGTSSISSNFLIKITNITVSDKVGSASDKTDVTTYNDTSATFGVSLVSPGDSITYDITIANQGTIDAVLKLITKTDTNNSAILFETSGVYEGDELKAGETVTMKVKVTYNSSVTSQPDNLESNLNLSLDYEQAGSSVTPTPNGITSEDLKALAVTTGDGLYADSYEEGRYVYKGASPSNYITFNNEVWRIMAIEPDNTLKIVRNENIGTMAWNENANNTWESSTLNMYLNGDYYNNLASEARDLIQSHTWGVGAVADNNTNLVEQIVSENSTSWTGNIALMSVSDYLRANTNVEQCGNLSMNNTNNATCKTTNWIYNIALGTWTVSPFDLASVWYLYYSRAISERGALGRVSYTSTVGNLSYNGSAVGVLPALYLSSNIELSGTGSSSDPYVIIN